MKRYIPLAVVGVVLIVWACVVQYTRRPDPQPTPGPTTEIVGPVNVRSGELAVYTTSEKIQYTKWITVPSGPQIKVTNGGQVLVIVFDSPGEYHIVLASSEGKGVELSKVKIRVDGEGPDPPRPPPIPPEPDVPDPAKWAEWAKGAAEEMSYPGLKADATALSGQLSAFSAEIASGSVKDTKTARVRLRQLTNSTLGENAKHWIDFSVEYSIRCQTAEDTGLLSDLRQYSTIYRAVAQGLKELVVATIPSNPYNIAIDKSKVDKKPILVVITSEGCQPCERLKSEWLPNSKAYGGARVVMLDRTLHSDVVEAVGSAGMKGSIKVPQVHIIRYVDGRWRQFSRVGYTSYSSLDRWVKSVFTWEETP